MNYQMNFSRLVSYDAGLPGITVDVAISLIGGSITLKAKLPKTPVSIAMCWGVWGFWTASISVWWITKANSI